MIGSTISTQIYWNKRFIKNVPSQYLDNKGLGKKINNFSKERNTNL